MIYQCYFFILYLICLCAYNTVILEIRDGKYFMHLDKLNIIIENFILTIIGISLTYLIQSKITY